MYCDQCGAKVAPGSLACPFCGAPLDHAPAGTPPAVGFIPPSAPGAPAPGVGPLVGPPPTGPVPPEQAPAGAGVAEVTHRSSLAVRLRHALIGQGPSWRGALGAVVLRNVRGTIVGIVCAWYNVPFIVFVAGIGAVGGGLAGVVSGTFAGVGVMSRIDAFFKFVFPLPVRVNDLLPTAAAQIGGIVGGILGALNGAWELAWRAAVLPWVWLYDGDPMWPAAVAVGQVIVALFVAALYVAWSSFTESGRLRVSGARRMSRREAEWLMPLVYEAAQRLNLRSLPRVLMDDRREPNATTHIRHVVIHQGLLEQLQYDREQVGAVIAHELAHWREGHGLALVWAKGVALPLYLLYELAVRSIRASKWRPVNFLLRFVFWSVIVTTRYIVIPAQASTWREAEYRADAAAAAAGYGAGLRAALSYIRHSLDGERGGWDAAVLNTHPPTELRLERLERPGQTYALREDQLLVRALPGWDGSSTVEKD